MCSSTLSLTSAIDGGQRAKPRHGHFTLRKDPYPLYRMLVGPQGRSGRVREISITPGFDLRTVQSVAGRYTDYATRPTLLKVPDNILCLKTDGSAVRRLTCHTDYVLPFSHSATPTPDNCWKNFVAVDYIQPSKDPLERFNSPLIAYLTTLLGILSVSIGTRIREL
jgi:hypothetical protein